MNNQPAIEETEVTKDDFLLFREYILDKGGIFLDDSKIDSLRISLQTRTGILGFKKCTQYYQYLKFHPFGEEEFRKLITHIAVNETCFFRNAGHFQILKYSILPELIAHRQKSGKKIVRIWSAGCSTGEEPYSLAILILELLPVLGDWRIEILGTDISEKALQAAVKGVYSERSLRLLDNYYRNKYFAHNNDSFELAARVKELVTFRYFNLVREPYPVIEMSKWDIIFCCNVMIYFKMNTIKRVVQNFYNGLNTGGYFFTGYAESLNAIPHQFQVINAPDCFLYRKVAERSREIKADTPDNRKEMPTDKEDKDKENEDIPDPMPSLYNQALELFIKEDYNGALEKLECYIQENKSDSDALLLLAQVHLEKGNLEAALLQCKDIIKINTFSETAYYISGFVHKQKKNYVHAVEYFNKAIYLDKNFALAHWQLAMIYNDTKATENALREFKNALKILNTYPLSKPLDLGGKFTPKLLIEICQKYINDLSVAEDR